MTGTYTYTNTNTITMSNSWNNWNVTSTITPVYKIWVGGIDTGTAISTNNTVWSNWTQISSVYTLKDEITTAAWGNWQNVTTYATAGFVPKLTKESLAEAKLFMDEQARKFRQEEAIRLEAQRKAQEVERLKKEKATKRAKVLLQGLLNDEQLRRFLMDECIPVDTAKGNKYLIRPGRAGNIDALDKEGKIMHRLCCHPKDQVPNYDTMVAQLMYLLGDEDTFLQTANVHRI